MRCDQEKLAALRVRIEIMRKRKQNCQKESQIAVDKKSQQIKAKESNNKITVTDTEVDDDGSTTSTEDYPDKKRNREQEESVISSDEIDEKRTDESNEDDRQSEEADVTRLPKVFDTSVSAEDYPDKKRNHEQEESVISSDEIDEKRTDESNEDDRQSEEADMTRLPKVFDTSVSAEDYPDKKRNREQEESVISSDEIDEKRTDESNEDDRQSEEADVTRLPKVFDISVSAEEFEEMLPANQISKQKKLQFVKGWTHIVADKFSKVNPACILKFKYHKVQEKKENSFRNRCFFFTKAECKHANCGVWTMKIDKKPKRESPVVITVTQTQPVIKHKKAGKRQLSNTQRKKAQERMKKESVESIFWQQYEDMPEAELRAENYTKCQSGTILRKAKSETKTGDILHPEPFTELVILKEVYDEENGYIQEISYAPFMAVLYTEESLNVTKNVIRHGSGVFYLDATGQVVKKQHQKRVLYYSMVINETNMPVVPILEFITDHHATNFIIRPLLTLKTALGPKLFPRRIEVDFSWAIIHSVLLTFNYMTINQYLERCLEICTGKDDCHFTVVHVCCVHILRAIRVTMKEKVKDDKLREIILRMVALLQNTTRLRQAVNVWKIFCTVLNNKKKTKAVEKAVGKMTTMMRNASLQTDDSDEDSIFTEDFGQSGLIGKDKEEKLGIRERSPFRALFIHNLVQDDSEDDDEVPENIYYHHEAINYIAQNYMPLYPMWSGCMLKDGKTRASNASVEAWMKIVKKDVLMGKKNLRSGEFVRTLRPVVGGRLRNVKMEQARKGSSKGKKRKIPAEDIQKAEESWAKKAKGKEKTSFLYSPIKMVPVPKSVKKTKPKEAKKKPSLTEEKRKETREKNPPGLVNVGNSCWLNSTLQAVAAMKQLQWEGDDKISAETRKVVKQLQKIEVQDQQIDPKHLREAAWKGLSYVRGQQQDGAEFVQNILHRNHKKIMTLQYTRTCQACKLVTIAEEETNFISVELASVRPASVSDCLSEFGKKEILREEDAPFCKNCKKNMTHSTQTCITRAEDLLINLKRFKLAKSGRHLKDNRDIRVKRVIGLKDVGVYRLRAVQCHIGSSMESGHYITVTVDDEWTCRRCDDTSVIIAHPASLDGPEIQKSAYVLYYETLKRQDAHLLIRNMRSVTLTLSGDIELMGLDLMTLLPGEKLNDQVLNAYMSIISKKFPNVAALDIFFSQCLVSGRDPQKFVKKGMFQRQSVLVPFIYEGHWTLLVIRPTHRTIYVFDSANGSKEPVNLLVKYLQERVGVQYKASTIKNLPKQTNCNDCGVFVCQFALAMASKTMINFSHTKIGYFRKKMLFECLASTLL